MRTVPEQNNASIVGNLWCVCVCVFFVLCGVSLYRLVPQIFAEVHANPAETVESIVRLVQAPVPLEDLWGSGFRVRGSRFRAESVAPLLSVLLFVANSKC